MCRYEEEYDEQAEVDAQDRASDLDEQESLREDGWIADDDNEDYDDALDDDDLDDDDDDWGDDDDDDDWDDDEE